MTVRAIVRAALLADAQLLAEGVTAAGLVGTGGAADSISLRPFIVLDWRDHAPGFPGHVRGPRVLDMRVNDVRGSYKRIDRIIRHARTALAGIAGAYDPDSGERVTEVFWTGSGGDLRDPDRGTILRIATFTVVGG